MDKNSYIKPLCLFPLAVFLLCLMLLSASCTQRQPLPDDEKIEFSGSVSDISDEQEGVQTSDPVAVGYDEYQSEIESIVQQYSGRVGVVCEACDSSWSIAYNADEVFHSASVIKLYILGAFMQKAEEGGVSLSEQMMIDSSQVVGGTGIIQGYGAGSTWSNEELLGCMITDSDNVAANVIIDELGFDYINSYIGSNEYVSTKLQRKMLDMNAINSGIENLTSARDTASILIAINQGKVGSADASMFAKQQLENQHLNSGLSEALSSEVVFAHKTGTLTNVTHDAGIVEAEKPFVLVVLTDQMSESESNACMSEIASKVNDWFL